MDEDKANEVISAINSISDDLRKELEKKFVSLDMFNTLKETSNLGNLEKRIAGIEKLAKANQFECEKIASLNESNRKVIQRHTKEIEDLASKLKSEFNLETRLTKMDS